MYNFSLLQKIRHLLDTKFSQYLLQLACPAYGFILALSDVFQFKPMYVKHNRLVICSFVLGIGMLGAQDFAPIGAKWTYLETESDFYGNVDSNIVHIEVSSVYEENGTIYHELVLDHDAWGELDGTERIY